MSLFMSDLMHELAFFLLDSDIWGMQALLSCFYLPSHLFLSFSLLFFYFTVFDAYPFAI